MCSPVISFAKQKNSSTHKDVYEQQQKKGLPYVELLKACAKKKDVYKGIQLHAGILRRGLLQNNPYVASALINMYAKCGELGQAQKVLEELHVREVVAWTSLIEGYAQQRQGHEALECFEQMRREGLSPNEVTFICILKACATIRAIDKGKQIHEEIADRGFLKRNVVLGTALVDMYVKCGMLAEAQQVLEELPVRDVVSWSSLIAGYAQQGLGFKAVDCYERMEKEGVSPNEITFTCVLKACGITRNIDKGKQIHCEIVNRKLLEKNIVLGNALVYMYAKCGALLEAQKVLKELPIRNRVSWSALISGFVQEGQGHGALICHEKMQEEGINPDVVNFSCILKACGHIGAVDKGKQIHEEIVNRGMLRENVVIGNALVDMYAKCGMLEQALRVLDELPVRNVVAWTAVIAGYAQHEKGCEALDCFALMRREGLSPNEITLSCILKACGHTGMFKKGEQILHEDITNGYLVNKNIILGTALVGMYIKCGRLAEAEEIHKELHIRDPISWSTLISGCAQQGQGYKALECFERMKKEGFYPDVVTFTCILKACTSVGAIDKGKKVHEDILSGRFLDKSIMLGNALVDMYAKCGLITKAAQVLENLPVRNVVSWNAFIGGYAQEGHKALNCFTHMQTEGVLPDEITFLCMLNACRHSHKLDEAQKHYEDMRTITRMKPMLEHHTCMVGVLGCSDEAMVMIKSMPVSFKEYPSCWLTFLGACKKWGNLRLALLAFDEMMMLRD